MTSTDTLLLEIGVEELPASYVDAALQQMPELIRKRLAQARLAHGPIRSLGTPRRLAVIVSELALHQPDLLEQVMGPPARVAFDASGKPTRAAEAFAAKVGCSVEELQKVETPKGAYLSGRKQEKGRPAIELLPGVLTEVCASLTFRKSMRWSDGDVAFGRPVRWIVSMLGERMVELTWAGLVSGKTTRGHRFLADRELPIAKASDYEQVLTGAHVVADPDRRRAVMIERLKAACAAGGLQLVEDDWLVAENLHLVEEPHVVAGGFDEGFLSLPESVIVAVAKGHQRYFCARGSDGKLAAAYLAVVGTAEHPDNIRRGNDRVMRARLADAKFFFGQDMQVPLEQRRAQLAGIVFQDRLGSVLDKVERMQALVPRLAELVGEGSGTPAWVAQGVQVAGLCKCDLATLMVGEFPELQGEMGSRYALSQGKDIAVAEAIRDHYLPKGAGDAPPASDLAAVVGMADRLDTLVGCFAVGLSPTGAADPYALRRACLGVLRTVFARGWDISVPDALAAAFAGYAGRKLDLGADETVSRLSEFFRDRLRGLLADQYPGDVVEACMAAGHDRPLELRGRVAALAVLEPQVRKQAGEVFKRARNITKDAPGGTPVHPFEVDASSHASEVSLFESLGALDGALQAAQKARDFPAAFAAVAALAPLLGAFFDNVFVITDDLKVRENRLRLLRAISERCSAVAHFNLLT